MMRQAVVACCQFQPVFKNVAASQRRADALVGGLKHGELDFLLLPEMAFTGYEFESRSDIAAYVEDPVSGTTVEWAQAAARRLHCYVMVGFPMREESGRFSNAMCVIGRDGAILHHYRKHFLYETDETWADPGPSFISVDLPDYGRVGFGICMDLNPHQFTAPFNRFEFGHFHARVRQG